MCEGCAKQSRNSSRAWTAANPAKAKAVERRYRDSLTAEDRERIRARDIELARSNPARYLVKAARARAKAAGLDFTITTADVHVTDRCPLLGIVLATVRRARGRHDDAPSLDRIDPARGYVPGNVWVVSWRANVLKRDATLPELESLVHGLRACFAMRRAA